MAQQDLNSRPLASTEFHKLGCSVWDTLHISARLLLSTLYMRVTSEWMCAQPFRLPQPLLSSHLLLRPGYSESSPLF